MGLQFVKTTSSQKNGVWFYQDLFNPKGLQQISQLKDI